MRGIAAVAVAAAIMPGIAAVPNLESYYIRHDFSKGSNNCILSSESGAKDVIGNKIAAAEGPNGEGNAVRISGDPWNELNRNALNSGWTFAACLRVGYVDGNYSGIIASIGRMRNYYTNSKLRSLFICSSSDRSQLHVRALRRYGSGEFTHDMDITLTDLGDVTAAFHTIVVTVSGDTVKVYWDGEYKASGTMTSGYNFGQDKSGYYPGWQFNSITTAGNNKTIGGNAYKSWTVGTAFYDVRLYANGKVFDANDVAEYAALYPSVSPMRPYAHIEANAANAVDTLYMVKQTSRLTADFQLLDKAAEGSLFGAEGDLAHGLGVDANGNLAVGALQGAATRNRMLATLDFAKSTFAATNHADNTEFLAGAIDAATVDGSVSTALFAEKLADGTFSGATAARIYSFEADEGGAPVAFFAPGVNPDTGAVGFKNIITGEWIGEAVESPSRALRFYDGVGCVDDYKFENSTLYAKLYASSEADGTVKIGDGGAGASAEGWIPHDGSLTLTATPASRHIFGRWVGDTWAIVGGDATARQIQVRASRAVQLRAEYVSAVPVYAKLDGDGKWRFFNDEMIPLNEEEGEDNLEQGVKVLFSSDAELKTLAAQHGEEIAAAGATYCLENDITLTADTDWRAFDFDMNGKTITLMGWDLYVRKPQGAGRITAGNLITNGDFENGSEGWTFGSAYERVTASGYGVTADTCKDRPFAGNHWCVIGTANDKAGATAHFTVPKDGECYIRFRFAKYDSDYSGYYVNCGIDEVNNVAHRVNVKPYPRGTSSNIYRRTLKAGDHTFIFGRYFAHILVDEATVSPESHLVFDIPEGEEYVNTDIVLGSTQDYFFDGMGLKVKKIGKGRLVLGKANTRFAGNGITSVIAEEGSVENAVSTGSGPAGAKVELLYGAQFDSKAETADGGYSLVIHTAGENEGEDVLTYTESAVYANAVAYVGGGTVAVAPDATLTFKRAATAADCAVEVSGGLVFDGNGLVSAKSLVFAAGATFSSTGTLPTTVVTGTYAPNTTVSEGAETAARPIVRLGDASHLETTLDLSRWTGVFDDSAAGSLSFEPGSTVTVDIGGLGKPAFLWKDEPDATVSFKATEAMRLRGLQAIRRSDGVYFQSGFTLYIR